MITVKQMTLEKVMKEIEDSENVWSLVNFINFEECAGKFCSCLLDGCTTNKEMGSKVRFLPYRLVAREQFSRSIRELVKNKFQDELTTMAHKGRIPFEVNLLQNPITKEELLSIMERARGCDKKSPNLLLDLSAIPREIAVHLCDLIVQMGTDVPGRYFEDVFIVFTPPKQVIARQGPGPFSVGGVRCVINPDFPRRMTDSIKASVLIFPGYEGFEAKAAIDTLVEHQTTITVAVNCFEKRLSNAINVLIGNLAVVSDAAERRVTLRYYFSEDDAYRVALDTVDRAINQYKEYPNTRQIFLVAPFGPKTSVLIGSLARHEYRKRCDKVAPDNQNTTDVLLLSASQSVSLYSIGSEEPEIFKLTWDD